MLAVEILGETCVLSDVLGVGGMGRVYAAEHPTHARVAVKLLHESLARDPALVACMKQESDAGQQVCHRNVVRVIDHGEAADGLPYVVMEHVPGVALGALIQRDGPLPLQRIRQIAAQIFGGLAAIHRAGLVHGDMKSDNVLVESTPLGDHVTIIDLGLARPPATRATRSGDLVSGTPEYMAPEVIRGRSVSPASDLYAVGVILYEMLTGTTPFGGGTTTMVFERQLDDDVVPPSQRCPERSVPPALEAAIQCALVKDPTARYASAEAFAAAVARALPAYCPDDVTPRATPLFSTTAPTRDCVCAASAPS
jgi:serine/threonine protein kinase